MYSLDIYTNPLGNISGANDFVYEGNGISSSMSLEAPLSIFANDLQLADTVDLNISSFKENNKINSGVLYLSVENGFPFDATIQIYLLDTITMQPLDSLLQPNSTITSAVVNNFMQTETATFSRLEIAVDKEKLDGLFDTKKLLIKARFNTTDKPNIIAIYNYYKFDVKLTANFNYTISTAKK